MLNELLNKLRKNGVTMSVGPSPLYHCDITLVTFEKDSKRLKRGIITRDICGELLPDSNTINILDNFLDEFLAELRKSYADGGDKNDKKT